MLDFRRHGDVFQQEAGDLQAVFFCDRWVDELQQRITQLAIALGHVKRGNLCLGQRFREDADDARAHGVGKLVQTEILIGARHFFEELGWVHDAEVIGTKGAQTDHAKVLVTHHDGVGRTPFVAREQACVDVVNIALEGRVEAVLPATQCGQDGNVLRGQLIATRIEQVCELAFGDKLNLL